MYGQNTFSPHTHNPPPRWAESSHFPYHGTTPRSKNITHIMTKQQSLSTLIKKLDRIFSQYIRLRDSAEYDHRYFRCISCGEVLPIEYADCGHYISRTTLSTRFSEDNCHAECINCNRFDPDHLDRYTKNLIAKIGEQRYASLITLSHNTLFRYAHYEIQELIKYYTQQVKLMQ